LTAVEAVRLLVLLAPYIPVLTTMQEQSKKDLEKRTVSTVMRELAQALKPFPDDFVAAFSILLQVVPAYIAVHCTAQELWDALPTLDKANDFRGLFRAATKLGVWHV
jgi:hypothetical protein